MRVEAGGWKPSPSQREAMWSQWIESVDRQERGGGRDRPVCERKLIYRRCWKPSELKSNVGKKTKQFSDDYNEVSKQGHGYLSFVRRTRIISL
ncbi:uncharacterized [Tachysurus ichikawai]